MSDSSVDSKEHHHAHHFRDGEHEFQTCKSGMWIFLLQEVLFFSPLFVGYLVFKFLYFDDFQLASQKLDWVMGAVNTVILLVSSFTVARAISSAQKGDRDGVVENLILTMVCGFGFLIVKYLEYSHKIHDGLLPGSFFTYEPLLEVAPQASLFFTFYFLMTGLHGLHVIGGLVVFAWLLKRALNNEFGPNYYTPLEMTGLYWHFVDLVWIYLFPLMYLVG